jgi:hypothetical protein
MKRWFGRILVALLVILLVIIVGGCTESTPTVFESPLSAVGNLGIRIGYVL